MTHAPIGSRGMAPRSPEFHHLPHGTAALRAFALVASVPLNMRSLGGAPRAGRRVPGVRPRRP